MKRTLFSLCCCICVLCAFLLTPITAFAATVDIAEISSLTVVYADNNYGFPGLEIKTYRIADVSPNGKYTLCGDFKNYPVSLYDISSQAEWQNITATLASYAVADNITPTITKTTDKTGEVKFEGLLPGMYLTLSVKHEATEQITVFENFLTAIPMPAGDGTYNYNVIAYPKSTTHTPTTQLITYKVVKQWKDDGQSALRPSSVTVDIYKDGKLYQTVKLSADNNWSYHWSTLNDSSEWTAVERKVHSKYTVNVIRQGNTIVLTNIYSNSTPPPPAGNTTAPSTGHNTPPPANHTTRPPSNNTTPPAANHTTSPPTSNTSPPKTGDTTSIELYIILMCVSGFMIVFLSLWKKRSEA